jgi:hypothetical protein
MSIPESDDLVVVRIGKPPAAVFDYQCSLLFTAKVSRDAIATGKTVIR